MAVIAIVVSALSSSLIPTVAAVATPLLLVAAPLLLLTDDEGPGGPEALAVRSPVSRWPWVSLRNATSPSAWMRRSS